ncbi:MAG: bifunctional phosphoglucose/phosphomannose isomerase [Bacteroidetes bacterium]|nr:bifunctional phosphoglucose/phosphomannose isomerase [Bacteroidota bacterium]
MQTLVEGFPAQLEEALSIGKSAVLSEPKNQIRNVLISGLGGSGIGGTIISELAFGTSSVPVSVTKGYFIPTFVDQHSLVIISSYSGNTEETLACMQQAIEKNAHIVCITSGGKVAELAKKHKLDCITIPGGNPPRSCLGFSLSQLIFIFVKHNLLPASSISELESSVALLNNENASIRKEAEQLSKNLFGKTPVIYCTTNNEGIAIRFRQQLNENAKVLCWHHVIPEMNHNELVGWVGGNAEISVVLFTDPDEYERNNYRIAINKEIIQKYTPHFTEVFSKGKSPIEKAIYLINLGDWASVFLANLRGVDSIEVNVINFLKGELSKK